MRRAKSVRRQMGLGNSSCKTGSGAANPSRRPRRSRLIAAVAVLAAAPLCTTWIHAANVTWDANPTNPVTPNDGSGNWNTTTDANWSNGAADLPWVNGDVAMIGSGGAAGTITINDAGGTVQAAGINFNAVGSGNYTVAGG